MPKFAAIKISDLFTFLVSFSDIFWPNYFRTFSKISLRAIFWHFYCNLWSWPWTYLVVLISIGDFWLDLCFPCFDNFCINFCIQDVRFFQCFIIQRKNLIGDYHSACSISNSMVVNNKQMILMIIAASFWLYQNATKIRFAQTHQFLDMRYIYEISLKL